MCDIYFTRILPLTEGEQILLLNIWIGMGFDDTRRYCLFFICKIPNYFDYMLLSDVKRQKLAFLNRFNRT